jgi:CubicO group peptidase (beta-lactamase class C family)
MAVVVPLVALVPLVAQSPIPGLPDLDGYVNQGLADWRIPGLALAVVVDDRVVVARGYGVRRLGHADAVDEHTLFGIGSVTKGMTAAALSMLVDEKRLRLDDTVVTHLPTFRLHDPLATRDAAVRDLLAHRTGVGRMTGNRLRWIPHRPRAELIERMRHLPLEQPFRSAFVYSNVMYTVAGELIPAITGTSYDDFVDERLFGPLAMARSTTRFAELRTRENVAEPHQEIDGGVVVLARRDFDAIAPAGAVWSSANEMTAWLRLLLGDGVFDGRRLLSATSAAELFRAQSLQRDRGVGHVPAYGLGFGIDLVGGKRVLRHGGAVDGMNSTLVLVPESKLGVFVTANVLNGFGDVLANRILDAFAGVADTDRAGKALTQFHARVAAVKRERDRIHAARAEGTKPSVPLSAFVGRYDDALYADAEVRLDGERLVLQLWGDDQQIAGLEHWHHDTFRAIWRVRAQREEFVHFTRGADGGVATLNVDWNLRSDALQVGAYPSGYRRMATWQRVEERR